MKFFESLEGFREMLDAVHNGLVIIDTRGIILVYNRAAGDMLAKDPKRVLGTHITDVSPDAWNDLNRSELSLKNEKKEFAR